ncbi:TPA: hypothetical protein ACLANS_000005 [Neisseria meningitidis]
MPSESPGFFRRHFKHFQQISADALRRGDDRGSLPASGQRINAFFLYVQ